MNLFTHKMLIIGQMKYFGNLLIYAIDKRNHINYT